VVATPRGPVVKLLDFGIAKLRSTTEFQNALTKPGTMMGTPEYMAPEQVYSADSVDARADIYSVGAMLYEMLAGTRPARGEDALQIAAFTLAGKVIRLNEMNPSVPAGLADVVHRAMAASPDQRFGSAVEMRDALLPFCGLLRLSLAALLAATPSPVRVVPRRGRPMKRRPELRPAGAVTPDDPPATRDTSPTQRSHPDARAPESARRNRARRRAAAPRLRLPLATRSRLRFSTNSRARSGIPTSPTRTRAPRRLSLWLSSS
jgi:serine/threonine-protein kinase